MARTNKSHIRDHNDIDHIPVIRSISSVDSTVDDDDIIELTGDFTLTIHTPTINRKINIINISGTQTIVNVTNLVLLTAGETATIYFNGTIWRAY